MIKKTTKKKTVAKKTTAKKSIVKKAVVKKPATKKPEPRVNVTLSDISKMLDMKKEKTKKQPVIVSNRIKTPDGTILISRNRYDFIIHTDKVTGETFSVDGGHEYLKRSFTGRYEEMSTYSNSSFELIRYTMEWGTYGIKGDQPLQYRTLMHMSNSHIAAIIKTQTHIPTWAKKIFEKELQYRTKKNILIEDSKPVNELAAEHADVVKKNLKPKVSAKAKKK